jgi:hypothetical protein
LLFPRREAQSVREAAVLFRNVVIAVSNAASVEFGKSLADEDKLVAECDCCFQL